MHRSVIIVLCLSMGLCLGACGQLQPLENPPVVAASATASLPPAEPSPEVASATSAPPTSTPTIQPSPTPAPTEVALPVERAAPEALDSAREIAPEQWSPSGRYLSYAVPVGADSSLTPGEPVQVKLIDTTNNLICAVPTDGARDLFLSEHFWLAGDRLLFRHAGGYLAVWETPCEGESTPVSGATPRFVRGVAASPDHSRWLTLSEDDLWLFDGETLQFQPVEGVTYGVHPGASWSPDGSYIALVQEGRAYRIDPATGQATEVAGWETQPEPASENFPGSPPQWIDDQRFIVPAVLQGSPQLVSVDGTRTDISEAFFGLNPVAGEAVQRAASLLPGEGEGWHILLAEYAAGSAPSYQLYHNETQIAEELALPVDEGTFNFVDMVDEGGLMLFNELDSGETPTYWLRAVDPLGSEWSHLAEGSYRATVSPDGQHVAIGGADGVTVFGVDGAPIATWPLGVEGAWLLWSPSGRHVVTTTLEDNGHQLYLLDLSAP